LDHVRVADLIERQTGQKFHPGHVWRILRSLGWSCQRPVGRATQRDEPAILQWKRVRWPEIKKKRSSKAEP
jgi:transposase